MKKKILITIFIIIVIILVIFSINYIKEKKDAETEFLLDNENKYILEKVGLAPESGLSSSKYYYEIDLNNKYIDYRYDIEYWDISQGLLHNKKRKLIKKYKISEEQALELEKYFERMNNKEETKAPTISEEIMQEISNGYYSVSNIIRNFTIKETEYKRELKGIFKRIDKDINL